MNRDDLVRDLRALGWRVRTSGELVQVVKHFQAAWALGPGLKVDGLAGPKTKSALALSVSRLHAGKPTASPHFSFSEFACRCGGKYSACARIWIQAELLDSLEKLRAKHYPHGLSVESGCRCEGHNRDVRGATNSQHKYGAACDVAPVIPRQRLAAEHMFAGIGYNLSSGKVAHVDRRDVCGHNTTGASLNRPTVWIYHR